MIATKSKNRGRSCSHRIVCCGMSYHESGLSIGELGGPCDSVGLDSLINQASTRLDGNNPPLVLIMTSDNPTPKSSQHLAYEALNSYFQKHCDDVLEIEVLPLAIQPQDGLLLQDGLSLGVPKKTLVLAYTEARQRFFKHVDNSDNSLTALHATKVMLLFDPEHITAANFRKRRLLALTHEFRHEYGAAYHTALRQELCFLNTILTSPLHRQSKSPNLWHHRLWILDPLVLIELESASNDQRVAFWHAEIAAVCKSGEQHPKNYYAWQYARRLMPRIGSSSTKFEIVHHIKDWCYKHPSDISGWSFLLSLVPGLFPMKTRQNLLRDVVGYAINLRAEQESLWVFIRMALAQNTLHGNDLELHQTIQKYFVDLKNDNSQHSATISECVSRTLYWIESFQEPTAIVEAPGST